MDSRKSLAAAMAARYVMFFERHDSVNANQVEFDCVTKYALCSLKQWQRLVAAEQRAAARDRVAIDRKLAASGR